MSHGQHPEVFVDAFIKAAAELPSKPFGVADRKHATNRKVPRGPQLYSQPTPAVTRTQPELVANQKAVPPPPVM